MSQVVQFSIAFALPDDESEVSILRANILLSLRVDRWNSARAQLMTYELTERWLLRCEWTWHWLGRHQKKFARLHDGHIVEHKAIILWSHQEGLDWKTERSWSSFWAMLCLCCNQATLCILLVVIQYLADCSRCTVLTNLRSGSSIVIWVDFGWLIFGTIATDFHLCDNYATRILAQYRTWYFINLAVGTILLTALNALNHMLFYEITYY